MSPRVSIITLNFNGLADTLACLRSLEQCTYPNYEILLFDNGSADQTEFTTLQALNIPNLRVFDNKENLGFAGGNNVGIELVLQEGKSQYVYFLNNDTEVEPDFLEQAVRQAEKDPRIGIVASLSLQFSHRDYVENAGHDLLSCGDSVPRGRNALRSQYRSPQEILGACSAGALYRVDTLRQSGGYEATFFLNFEDADLSLRCLLFGWRCVFVPQSIIYHKVNASIRKIKNEDYVIRSQMNQLKAYWYNVPTAVIWLNAPWIVLREVLLVLGTIISGRWSLTRLWWKIRIRFWQNRKAIFQVRQERQKKRQVSSWYIWKRQKNWLGQYLKYFWEIIVRGKKIV